MKPSSAARPARAPRRRRLVLSLRFRMRSTRAVFGGPGGDFGHDLANWRFGGGEKLLGPSRKVRRHRADCGPPTISWMTVDGS